MKTGQIITLAIGGVVVALMLYVALSGGESTPTPAKPSLAPVSEAASSLAQNPKEVALEAEDEEMKKIRELQGSVKNRELKVSHLYSLKCAPCHGYDGEGKIAPSLLGKSETELLAKLRDYKEDKVPNSLMKGLLTNSTQQELEDLAKEIAGFSK